MPPRQKPVILVGDDLGLMGQVFDDGPHEVVAAADASCLAVP